MNIFPRLVVQGCFADIEPVYVILEILPEAAIRGMDKAGVQLNVKILTKAVHHTVGINAKGYPMLPHH